MLRWAFGTSRRGRRLGLSAAVHPPARPARAELTGAAEAIVAGGYWLRDRRPAPSWRSSVPARLPPRRSRPGRGRRGHARRRPAAGHLARPAARDWRRRWRAGTVRRGRRLLAPLPRRRAGHRADGHPATLSWLGGVAGNAWCRSGSTASASPATSRIFTGCTGSTATPSSMPRRGPACARWGLAQARP